MRPSSSTSDSPAGPPDGPPGDDDGHTRALFGPLFGSPAVDRATGDRAWLEAMLAVERGLAAAGARAGLVPAAAAAAIAAGCNPGRFDAADLGRRAVASGNPVIPLVRDLAAGLPADAARWVHLGATSQDVLDTAAALVAREALAPILADLGAAAERCAGLAERHRGTLLAGRTLLQQALPVSFGLKCAGWLVAVDEAAAGLAAVRRQRLAVQLGGAVGTLASLGAGGAALPGLLAEELGLTEPTVPWHTNRVRVAELAASLGTVCGVLAKIALDVLLLAQTEVAEVAEGGDDAGGERRGGSSTMPHKRNPVRAVLVTACARRAPGLVATLLATMAQEHERAAGAWHAEWEPLVELLRLTGGAAAGSRELLGGLEVDAARMREGLERTGGLLLAERVAGRLAGALGRVDADDLVARVARGAAAQGRRFRDALLEEPAVREHLSEEQLDAALDPAGYLGSAGVFIDRALAAHAAPARRGPTSA